MADVRKAKLIDDGGETPQAVTKVRPLGRLPVVIAASVMAGMLAAFAISGAVAGVVYYGQQAVNRKPMPARTREEFQAFVLGKDQEFLLKALGTPGATNGFGGSATWFFYNSTYDPITGRADKYAAVSFKNGVVTSVGGF